VEKTLKPTTCLSNDYSLPTGYITMPMNGLTKVYSRVCELDEIPLCRDDYDKPKSCESK